MARLSAERNRFGAQQRRWSVEMDYPLIEEPQRPISNTTMLQAPPTVEESAAIEWTYGPNIVVIPDFDLLPNELRVPELLEFGDGISTHEIMPAGVRVLPFRSNIPAISQFVFEQIDPTYVERSHRTRGGEGYAIVAGRNYGQGSSREHTALAPRYLGLRIIIAISFAGIYWQNHVNFGIPPLTSDNSVDYDEIALDDELQIADIRDGISATASREKPSITARLILASEIGNLPTLYCF